jgi:hypothetical protein
MLKECWKVGLPDEWDGDFNAEPPRSAEEMRRKEKGKE